MPIPDFQSIGHVTSMCGDEGVDGVIDFGIGVAEAARPYVLKRIDLDFFEDA